MAKKDVNLLELNRYRNVNERDVENVKLFLSGKNKETKLPSWAKAFKAHLSLEKGNLKLGDRIVVANQEREALMRKLIYSKDSDVPPSRDAGSLGSRPRKDAPRGRSKGPPGRQPRAPQPPRKPASHPSPTERPPTPPRRKVAWPKKLGQGTIMYIKPSISRFTILR